MLFDMCDVKASGLKSFSTLGWAFLGTGMKKQCLPQYRDSPQLQAQVETMLKGLPPFRQLKTGINRFPQLPSDLICGDGGERGLHCLGEGFICY